MTNQADFDHIHQHIDEDLFGKLVDLINEHTKGAPSGSGIATATTAYTLLSVIAANSDTPAEAATIAFTYAEFVMEGAPQVWPLQHKPTPTVI